MSLRPGECGTLVPLVRPNDSWCTRPTNHAGLHMNDKGDVWGHRDDLMATIQRAMDSQWDAM